MKREPDLDPLTQDIWWLPLMSNTWHLWKAGSPVSVCGLPWETVSGGAWDAKPSKPLLHACAECGAKVAAVAPAEVAT